MDFQAEYNRIVTEIINKLDLPSIEDYYPIADMPLTKHTGIDITGNFETDDDTAEGRLSYVTVRRDVNALDPANGYGFAWMKGDGTMFNVYLVDNSPLANDLFVSENFIVNANGENTWKAAAKVLINTNTVYNFRLVIGEDNAMSLRIWQSGDTEPLSPQLQIGAPNSPLASSGDRLGIGVMGTKNCQWWYDDIVVTTSAGIHTSALFRLRARPSDFPEGSDATINYYGYGVDGDAPDQLFGVTTFVRTLVSGIWDWAEFGNNTATNVTDRALTKISTSLVVGPEYVSDDGFIDILATTTYSTTNVTDLTTYYVSLERTLSNGVHTGGCADVYINDPSKIVVAEQTVNNITSVVELSALNGFLGPLHSIIDVQIAIVGDSFIPNQDWVLVSGDDASAYSTNEFPSIVFNEALLNYKVKVIYRYYQTGADIQTMLDSDQYRYSGTSNLAKITPPVLVRFNDITFRGSISDAALKRLLKEYVNGLTSTTISKSEIINLLYSNGVSYIDIQNVNIGIIEANYLREIKDEVELISTYTRPALTAFYTDAYEMTGIQRG